ncbi:MAG: hypothetical protein ACOC9N_02805 [Gemmatimonadota bacterium]
MRQLRYTALALATVFAVGACGDDEEGPTGPSVADIAGTWDAAEFHIQGTEDPETQNLPIVPDMGGSFETTIQDDGSFTATLVIPDPTSEEEPQPIPLTGTLSIDGDTLTVDFDATTEALGFDDFTAEYTFGGDTFDWFSDSIDFDFPADDVDGEVPATISVELERVS